MPVSTWPAAIHYEVGFNTAVGNGALPPAWTDISSRVQGAWRTTRGRQYELDTNPAGQWTVPLANSDGWLDPSNTSSPYYPNVIPYRPCRIRVQPGVNLLTPDQATAGQGTPFAPGPVPVLMGVTNDAGYVVTLTASGSAYTGTQVYQVTLPNGATAGTTVLLLPVVSVIPGQWYSFTAEVVISSGNSVSTNVELLWYGAGGASVGTSSGTASTITSGSTSWTALTASGQALASTSPAQYVALKVEIASGTLSAATTWRIGALQLEASATPTPWQAPQAVSRNLFPQVIATGSQSMSPVSDAVTNWWYQTQTGGEITQAVFLTAPASGQTAALAWTTPSGTTSSSGALWVGSNPANPTGPVGDCVQVVAGSQYTASVYLSRASSADVTIAVTLTINWFTAAGQSAGTTAGSAATVPVASSWTRGTVTGTAPAGAVWGRVSEAITTPSSTTATNVIYHAGWQFEQAGSASAWIDPGPTLQIFNGGIERWPQNWVLSGTYGQSGAIGVDAFATLSQGILPSPFVAEVLALGPNFLFQLSDPAGSTSAADTTGKRPPAPVENSPFGAGSLVFGTSVSATSPTGGVQGTTGTCATFNNDASNTGTVQFPETFISVHKTTVTPGPPNTGPWTRILAFHSTTTPTLGDVYGLWIAIPGTYNASNNSAFQMAINGSGQAFLLNSDAAGAHDYTYTGTTNLFDGNWHMLAIGANPGSSTVMWVDGVVVDSWAGAGTTNSFATDTLGCAAYVGANLYADGHIGDLAHAIELPFLATNTQMTNLYTSWRSASAGDSTGQRIQRVLTWDAYTGATSIDAGATTDMGPATDIGGSTAIDVSTSLLPGGVAFTGGSALQALNTIAQTESGNVYVSSAGAIAFRARSDRYNQTIPTFVFGENTAAGEWPYESVNFDYDPSHLYTGVQVTQYSTSQVAAASNPSAQAAYGQRILQVTMNQGLYAETTDASDYLLARYDTARMRIPEIVLHPSAMPGLWAVCLALEIGTRIRVMRRPPYPANTIQFDGFVESVSWTVDPNGQKATVTLQCSPADLARYWTLAALHTTLAVTATASTNTATINALPDSALNPLNASLPQGYQLTFDPGTAIQETLTLQPPLPATNPGYLTATLTFTTNFQFTHQAGATVCEPLPTGYTNPATWDAGSVLGAASTTFAAAASSGANTFTVSALSDSTTNTLGSDWNVGDLLWLSPGTPNFEGYNLLTPNQSTAGEGALPLAAGTAGSAAGVGAFYGTPTVTASGSAFQGSNVWQVAVGASVATGHTLINVAKVAATPLLAFTTSFYTRSVTTGANPQVNAQVVWLDGNGNSLGSGNGSTVTLTGATGAGWTRVTASGAAPAGTVWAAIGVNLSSAPTVAWSFQADALQWEQNASASTFQVCPQIQSVAATEPGYTTSVITLANNLANNHAVDDLVCDPLPPGVTNPSVLVPTARLAY